jgi:hypothetical protein
VVREAVAKLLITIPNSLSLLGRDRLLVLAWYSMLDPDIFLATATPNMLATATSVVSDITQGMNPFLETGNTIMNMLGRV